MKPQSTRPQLLKIIPPLESSIVVKGDDIAWNNPWHYHPEIELLYCIKGRGTNFIGNSIRSIEEGEVLLLGKNLPHTRQRDRTYYEQNPHDYPTSVVVQFREDFLGEKFFRVGEFAHMQDLLNRALRGIQFTGNTRTMISSKLERLSGLNPTLSIIELLSLMDLMANSSEFIYLNTPDYISAAHERSSQDINKVYLFTVGNFRENIQLRDVAALTNHSNAGFCRYFRKRTRKSYFQYLTEIRIAYAGKLLSEGNLDVGEVASASGFNNLSHFHKQFKKLMTLTPTAYRKASAQKIPVAMN